LSEVVGRGIDKNRLIVSGVKEESNKTQKSEYREVRVTAKSGE